MKRPQQHISESLGTDEESQESQEDSGVTTWDSHPGRGGKGRGLEWSGKDLHQEVE